MRYRMSMWGYLEVPKQRISKKLFEERLMSRYGGIYSLYVSCV